MDDDDFEYLFQLYMIGLRDARAINEEIERTYRGMKQHKPEHCKHGKTKLTCSDCYFYGEK